MRAVSSLLVVLLACVCLPAHSQSFLADQLPLKVVSIYPSTEVDVERGAYISGTDPITVTFSRPLIALGSDWASSSLDEEMAASKMPFTLTSSTGIDLTQFGKFRFVTTYIARFDPDENWVSDLIFDLEFNPDLTTYDGVPLTPDPELPTYARYYTAGLYGSISSVSSDQALELTGGYWDAYTGLASTDGRQPATYLSGPECPPDGVLILNFGYPVDATMRSALTLLSGDHSTGDEEFTVTLCDAVDSLSTSSFEGGSSTCVKVVPQNLAVDTQYALTIPAGTTYGEFNGPISEQIRFEFTGLRRFAFTNPGYSVGSTRIDLWLRHGLDASVSLESVMDVLTIYESAEEEAISNSYLENHYVGYYDIPSYPESTVSSYPGRRRVLDYTIELAYELEQPDQATLRIFAAFEPDTSYALLFEDSTVVVDGFGLPLVAHAFTFETNKFNGYFSSPDGEQLVFEDSQFDLESWSVLSRGFSQDTDELNLATFPVAVTTSDIISALDMYATSPITTSGAADFVQQGDYELGYEKLDLAIPSNTFLTVAGVNTNWPDQTIVHVTDLAITVMTDEESAYVWVTRLSDGAPVEGAVVTLYQKNRVSFEVSDYNTYYHRQEDEATSDAEGMATLTGACSYIDLVTGCSIAAVLSTRDASDMVFEHGFYIGPPSYSYYDYDLARVSMVTDRAVYQAGDTVYLKGYVRTPEFDEMTLLDENEASTFTFEVWWTEAQYDYSNHEVSVVGLKSTESVSISDDYGSFHVEIEIPEGATNGDKYITLQSDLRYSYHTVDITVSDPRVPTASVALNVDSTFYRVSSDATEELEGMPVSMTVLTSTQQPIAGAEIDLIWSVSLTTGTQEGVVTVTTDENGVATSSVTLEDLLSDTDLVAYLKASGSSSSSSSSIYSSSSSSSSSYSSSSYSSYPYYEFYDSIGPTFQTTLSLTARWIGFTGEFIQTESQGFPIAFSDWVLSAEPSLTTVLPGVPFGLYLSIYDQAGQSVLGEDMQVSVVEANEEDPSVPGEVVASCIGRSDGGVSVQCYGLLELPNELAYTVEVTAVDTEDYEASYTASLYTPGPVSEWNGFKFTLDQSEYTMSEQVVLTAHNPYGSVHMMTRFVSKYGSVSATHTWEHGVSSIALDLPDECRLGCLLSYMVAVGRLAAQELEFPSTATTLVPFDLHQPRAITGELSLRIIEESESDLTLSVTPSVDSTAPGSTITLDIELMQGEEDVEGEVAIFVVDESFLQLKYHPLQDFNPNFVIDMTYYMSLTDTRFALASAAAYQLAIDTYERRVKVDPYLTPSFAVSNYDYAYNKQEFTMEDEDFYASKTTRLTAFPSCQSVEYCGYSPYSSYYSSYDTFGFGGYYSDPYSSYVSYESSPSSTYSTGYSSFSSSPVESYMSMGSTTESGSFESSSPSSAVASGDDFLVRTNFETTPLFVGSYIMQPGQNSIDLELPDTIGTFSIRAYAVNNDHEFASSESDVVVKKALSLQALLPRIVRNGDVFEAGVTVASDDADMDGYVVVTASTTEDGSSVAFQDWDTKDGTYSIAIEVKLVGTTPVRVKFDMIAEALGSTTFVFTVAALGEDIEDAFEAELEVLAVQDSVLVATSMAIEGSEDGTPWEEGIQFPYAVKASGFLQMSSGVGRFPAVQAFASNVLAAVESYGIPNAYISGYTWAGLTLLTAAIHPYTQGVESAEGSVPASVANWFDTAVEELEDYTDDRLGLRSSTRYEIEYYHYPNVDLNQYGLYLNLRLSTSTGTSLPAALVNTWANALETEVVRQITDQLERNFYDPYVSIETLAQTLLVMGPYWTPAQADMELLCGSCDELTGFNPYDKLSLNYLAENIEDLSETGSLYIALAFLLRGTTDLWAEGVIENVLDELVPRLHVLGRTAYISHSYDDEPESQSLQSLALSVLMLSGGYDVNPLVIEKLANYIAQGDANSGYWGSSVQTTLDAALALSDYDTVKGNGDPDVDLTVNSLDAKLMTEYFGSAADDVVEMSVPWTDLPSTYLLKDGDDVAVPSSLYFTAQGSGEVSVAVALDFVPLDISESPVYRGIYVEKIIRKLNPATNEPEGDPLQVVETGTLVHVTLQVTTPDELTEVNLVDLVPGGLEPLDENVFDLSTIAVSTGPTYYTNTYYSSYVYTPYWARRLSFGAPETLTDRVRWSANSLSAGSHEVSYIALAVTSGVFSLPPAKASVSAQPELMGLSGGGTFVVTDEEFDDAEEFLIAMGVKLNPTGSPMECEEECGSKESCDVYSGTCVSFMERKMVAKYSDIVAEGETCVGFCDGESAGGCWCDDMCQTIGDCCGDYMVTACLSDEVDSTDSTIVTLPESAGSCQDAGSCDGKGGGVSYPLCWCDEACVTHSDCCHDYEEVCVESSTPVDVTSCAEQCACDDDPSYCCSDDTWDFICQAAFDGKCTDDCVEDLEFNDVKDSCEGNCGVAALNCWCDSNCSNYGDCCSDYSDVCSV